MTRRMLITASAIAAILILPGTVTGAVPTSRVVGVNLLLRDGFRMSPEIVQQLGAHGTVLDKFPQLGAVTMRASADELDMLRQLPFVAAANEDARRTAIPISKSEVSNTLAGLSTWNLDLIDVTYGPGTGNRLPGVTTGAGVYVAVLDTGLLPSWSYYFPAQRIATQYATAFGGGGGGRGVISRQPMKWQMDQDGHGTHVTSTVIGYRLGDAWVQGVAPEASIIPVKVLNQDGSGWSSVIAAGITYVTDLKKSGALGPAPVVINMSLGGPALDVMEKAAIDYAIANGVIIVASAGNEGEAGMGYPGAYAPVISAAAVAWDGEWDSVDSWWYALDVPEFNGSTHPNIFVTDFSSRAKAGQDLDVAAPGDGIVGPYQTNGQLAYYFLSGTSMASPHVAGAVALLAEKCPTVTVAQAEARVTSSARDFGESTDAAGAGLLDVPALLTGACPA